ncbi:hypothetical protein C0995_008118, partial [Termitomyces sp. Mi166
MDKHREFNKIIKKMGENSDPLNVEVHNFIDQRCAVNRMLLTQIQDTYALQGFTGDPTPGISKPKSLSQPSAVTPEPITRVDPDCSDSDSDDEL